jgi:protein-tyrosine phosphatase
MGTANQPFDRVLNFRDVGASINNYSTPGNVIKLRCGRLYRSARLDESSARDQEVLVREINTVIDLRSHTEHINAAKKHLALAAAAQSAAAPVPEAQVTDILKIPVLRYEQINLNGKGFERALVWKLSYSSLARLVFLMALGELVMFCSSFLHRLMTQAIVLKVLLFWARK